VSRPSLFTSHAYRVGFTTRGDVLKDGEVVMSVVNMFTVRGAQKEAERMARDLRAGRTVAELIRENQDAALGW
jgi:uncharacterized Ntn-hydrolase superfamily protein